MLPAADEGDPLAERLGLLDVVGREEDRGAVGVQGPDVVPQVVAQLEVDARGGLVEDHQARAVQQGARQQQTPPHPPREHVGVAGRLAREVEGAEHLVGPQAGVAARHAEVAPVQRQQLPHRHEAVEGHLLRGVPDRLPRPRRRLTPGRDPEHRDVAAARAGEAHDAADQRRLAGAVRAEQPEEGPLGDREVEAGQRVHAPGERLADAGAQEGGGGRGGVDHDPRRYRAAPPPASRRFSLDPSQIVDAGDGSAT